MRQVVADTGPVLHLLEARAVELLRLTGQVAIPEAVGDQPLSSFAERRFGARFVRSDWVDVQREGTHVPA